MTTRERAGRAVTPGSIALGAALVVLLATTTAFAATGGFSDAPADEDIRPIRTERSIVAAVSSEATAEAAPPLPAEDTDRPADSSASEQSGDADAGRPQAGTQSRPSGDAAPSPGGSDADEDDDDDDDREVVAPPVRDEDDDDGAESSHDDDDHADGDD